MYRINKEDRGIWIPDLSKSADESNYESFPPETQKDIARQIHASIRGRITFINYNGERTKKLLEYACDPAGSIFDNAVIVIPNVFVTEDVVV